MSEPEKQRVPEIRLTPEDFIAKLPKKIPGASRIEIPVNTPGARYCLVHLRQEHLFQVGGQTQRMVEDFLVQDEKDVKLSELKKRTGFDSLRSLRRAARVQTDIHTILQYLTTKFGFRTLYREGMDETLLKDIRTRSLPKADQKKEIERLEQELTSVKERVATSETPDPFDLVRISILERDLGVIGKKGALEAILQGAQSRVKLDGLRLPVTENPELGEDFMRKVLGTKDLTQEKYDEMYQKYKESRENFLLEQISKAGKGIALTIYGGGHDWTNNILEWNKDPKHAEQKFSLVVITPASYVESTESRLPLKAPSPSKPEVKG